jgi:hypothetical protein
MVSTVARDRALAFDTIRVRERALAHDRAWFRTVVPVEFEAAGPEGRDGFFIIILNIWCRAHSPGRTRSAAYGGRWRQRSSMRQGRRQRWFHHSAEEVNALRRENGCNSESLEPG